MARPYDWKVGPTRKKLYYHRGRHRGRTIAGRNRFYTPKAPRGAPGSDEAVLYAGNILYDPGFEIFVQNAGPTFLKPGWEDWTGASVYALPRLDLNSPTGQRWPSGDYVDRKDVAQWAQYTEPYQLSSNEREASMWFVVRREGDLDYTTKFGPNLGVFMARWYNWQSSGSYSLGNAVPGGLIIQGPGMPPGYSGRTEPGALITWGFTAWVNTTTGSPTMDLCLTFYKQDGTPLYTTIGSHSLTTTKTDYTLSSDTPSGGSYFIRACVTFRGTGSKSTLLSIDSGILGVE